MRDGIPAVSMLSWQARQRDTQRCMAKSSVAPGTTDATNCLQQTGDDGDHQSGRSSKADKAFDLLHIVDHWFDTDREWHSQFGRPPKGLRWTSRRKGRARYLFDTRCRQVLMHVDLPPGQFDEPLSAPVDVRRAGGSRAHERQMRRRLPTPHARCGPACRGAHCAMRTDLPRCTPTNDEKSGRRTSESSRAARQTGSHGHTRALVLLLPPDVQLRLILLRRPSYGAVEVMSHLDRVDTRQERAVRSRKTGWLHGSTCADICKGRYCTYAIGAALLFSRLRSDVLRPPPGAVHGPRKRRVRSVTADAQVVASEMVRCGQHHGGGCLGLCWNGG
ncbi:hypothetical protein PENSPDRAFT_104688 [Peniophora sp. CONT]|nr:hypothetical protein PENSPDRAFT_104688 [Peniophora sp. CONT]